MVPSFTGIFQVKIISPFHNLINFNCRQSCFFNYEPCFDRIVESWFDPSRRPLAPSFLSNIFIMRTKQKRSWTINWRAVLTAVILTLSGAVKMLAAPASQNFDSLTATEGANGVASYTVGGVTYTVNGTGTVETYNILSYWGVNFPGFTNQAVIGNYNGDLNTSITVFKFSSAVLTNIFKLNSLAAMANEIQSSYSYSIKYKVQGYRGGTSGTLVASVAQIDMRTSGTYGTGTSAISYARTTAFDGSVGNGGILTFGSAWDDIDTVVFTVTDGVALQLSLDSINFSPATPLNTPPVVSANTGLTLNEGTIGSISASQLAFTDAQQGPSAVTYTVTTLPAHGLLLLNGSVVAINGTFTQANINSGALKYAHDGTDTTSDSLAFTVSDGAGGNVTGQSFNLTITAVNDATALAATPTITFGSAPGGTFALDGMGGSTDVNGLALDVYFGDASRNQINAPLTYEDPYAVGAVDSGLAVNYASNAGSYYVIIKSLNGGDHFWLQSLQLCDYGGNNVKIEAFTNGVSQGSVNVTVNTSPWYFTFDKNGALTPAIFNNANEIRISGQDSGVIWLTINNIKIAPPAGNVAPTDIALSASTINQSAGVNGTVGTLSSTDPDSSTFTYTLVSGTGSTDNSLFNISGSTLRANNATTLSAGNHSVRIQTDDGSGGLFAKAFTVTVVDNIAPAAPSQFAANASGANVVLSWNNPAESDFASTTIRRSTTAFPATINDGTLVAQGLTGTSDADNGLADGTYYYSIFAKDASGNISVAATATVTVDTTPPTVGISAPSTSLTRSGPVNFTVTWSDVNLNTSSISLSSGQVIVNSTGTAMVGSVNVSGSGNTRTVQLSGISGDGTVGISVPANTATDVAGNSAGAAGPSATVTVDNTSPTVTIGLPSVSTTAAGPVSYTITYGGADTITLSTGNITLIKTGSANGTAGVSGTGTATRMVTISGITGSGTLGISLAASTAADTAGNTAPAAGPSTTFAVNTPPTAAVDNAAITVGEGSSATNTGTFADADGNATVTLSASVGAINQDNNAGTWSWSFHTTDGPEDSQTVTITADDGINAPVTTTFALVVTNIAPTANAQSITTPENTATNIVLTASDPGADTIAGWAITAGPTNGTLSGTAPNVTYLPGTNFSGSDAFRFTATDSDGAVGAEGTISISVTPVNQPPVAGADSIARPNNTKLAKVTKAVLLANDTDPENDPLSITAAGNATPSGATVTMAGTFVIYTAPATNAGDGGFTYTLSDGPGGHAVTGTVAVIQTSSTPTGAGPNSASIAASGQNYTVSFIGVPARMYRVQYTTSLSAPYTWNEFSPLAIFTAPTNGVFSYTDVNPPGPVRLYRAVPHP